MEDTAVDENITEMDLASEVESSFLKYSMAVVLSRALPDVRDGLKPVHRRILFIMDDDRVYSDRKTVKSARVVGSVLGKAHPHGDSAVYQALVKLAQPWSNLVPFVHGKGNWGSLGDEDPAAAPRYTECRLTPAAEAVLASLREDTVDWVPNYDSTMQEPVVLPSAIPNLLVNGTSGIAVGMACNFAPHNLREVVAALQLMLRSSGEVTLDEVMKVLPAPDFPTGGMLVGADGIRAAYETGRGAFKIRARSEIKDITARKRGIVVTELPYGVGPEAVMAKIAERKKAGQLEGVSNAVNYTDRAHGLQLVVEVKAGFNPEVVLQQLYRLTPMEQSFSVNNTALVGTEPRQMGLLELMQHFLAHRVEVVTRRSRFRLKKAQARAHIVEGLVLAHANIDEVVKLIKASKTTQIAREKLMKKYKLSEVQANSILEMTLRRLTGLEIADLKAELAKLNQTISDLETLLGSDTLLNEQVSTELQEVADKFGTDRKSTLLGADVIEAQVSATDDPVMPAEPRRVVKFADGSLQNVEPSQTPPLAATWWDVMSTSKIGAVTSRGRLLQLNAADVPTRQTTAEAVVPGLQPGESVVLVVDRDAASDSMVAFATRNGVIKKMAASDFPKRDDQVVISLKEDDQLVWAGQLPDPDCDLVLVSSSGHLLRTSLKAVRAQGRTAGGVSGMRLAPGAQVLAAGPVTPDGHVVVVTDTGAAKATPVDLYPAKGRGGGGVRAISLRKAESAVTSAAVTCSPPVVLPAKGRPVPVPVSEKRDGSSSKLDAGPSPVAQAA